jgi:O-antigen biosynthesis protein WbqP
MLRFLDIALSALGIILVLPVMVPLIIILYLMTGSALFTQVRIGRACRPFTIYKLRTMVPNAPSVPTHCIDPAAVTVVGALLRKYKLDEIPQLLNVLKGEMSLVGPRPCLPMQEAVIQQRLLRGVFRCRPGITGLAQVMGVDMSSPNELARLDAEMLERLSLREYFRLLVVTITGNGFSDRVRPMPFANHETVRPSTANSFRRQPARH